MGRTPQADSSQVQRWETRVFSGIARKAMWLGQREGGERSGNLGLRGSFSKHMILSTVQGVETL